MNSLKKITFYSFTTIAIFFVVLHLSLLNVNTAEWGDSYRILRASEFIRNGSYPTDEKRQPFLSLVLATRPFFVDQVTFGRIILFLFSAGSFFVFYKLLCEFIVDRRWRAWGLAAFMVNNVYLYWSLRIMTDVPFGFFVLLVAYFYHRWKEDLSLKRLAVLGLFTGLAILTRFEGYLLLASLFAAIGLKGINLKQLSFKTIKNSFLRIFLVGVTSLLVIAPYLIMRNPLTSSYFEEPGSRQYGIKMILTFAYSLFCVFGLIPAIYVILTKGKDAFKQLGFNLLIVIYSALELLLILAWPAALPRLFVPIIPFLIILLTLSLQNYFETPSKRYKMALFINLALIVIYAVGQYYLKLQFLLLDKKVFLLNLILQALVVLFLVRRSFKWFAKLSIAAMLVWSIAVIYMHKDIFISVKTAAVFASQNYQGNIGYNDISSVSDWYINYQNKQAKTRGFYYNTEKKQNIELAPLKSAGVDYLLITNEHNTTMTLDLNKRPFLKELKTFAYKVNGQKFVTRIVKVL